MIFRLVNKNYRTGRRREYQVMNHLRKEYGFTKVSRSAASHSPVDLWASDGNQPYAIQVKAGKSRFTEDDKALLLEWASAFKAMPVLAEFRKRGQMVFTNLLTGRIVGFKQVLNESKENLESKNCIEA